MYLRTALVAALLSIATLAHADTDRHRWLSLLDKYAVYVGTPKTATIVDAFWYAKSACICTQNDSLRQRPGFVVVAEGVDGLISSCAIPSFDENGALEIVAGCGKFVPLAK